MKLITFGCSFTNYCWPTWADIIATDLSIEHENWAMPGIGNQAISKRMMSKHVISGFDPDDIVLVQWTYKAREDRYLSNGWAAYGSVFNQYGVYGDKFTRTYWDPKNDEINTAHAQLFARNLLPNNTLFEFCVDENVVEGASNYVQDEEDARFQEYLSPAQKKLPVFSPCVPFEGKHYSDGHPDPKFWLNYVSDVIYPELGFTIKQSTVDKVMRYQNIMTDYATEVYASTNALDKRMNLMRTKANMLCNEFWNLNKIQPNNYYLNKKILF